MARHRPVSLYLFLLALFLLLGPSLVGGASDEAPMVGCTFPNFGCSNATGPEETETPSCILKSAVLNERELDPSAPLLTVAPGARVAGTAVVETNNTGPSSYTAPLAATTSFGDHRTSYWGVSSNIPAGKATFEVEINLSAPSSPGTHYIFIAWYWEKTYGNVMSLTSWKYPEGDQWDDDVDVADWTDYQAQQGIDNGWVETTYLDEAGTYQENVVYPATAIRLEVQGP